MEIIYESHKTRIEKFQVGGKGTEYVKKTVKGKFAGLICSREVKTLEKLRGINGVQKLEGKCSSNSFISEFVSGIPIEEVSNISPDITSRIHGILESVHGKGISDLDFGHKSDWLIDNDGKPILIDFAASIIPGDLFYTPLFNLGVDVNLRYLYKYKAQLFGIDTLSLEELEVLQSNNRIETCFNVLRGK